MQHREKINFALQGSLIDLISGAIPNYSRSSSLWLEEIENDDLKLRIVDSHHPAIREDGSIFMESGSLNEGTWSSDLSRNDWIKGTNITVRPDEALVPTRRFYGDRVAFSGSPQETLTAPGKQTMTREFQLSPDTTYTLSVVIRKWAGEFSTADEIRLVGPGNSQAINLSQLNNYPKKYRILETTLSTNGSAKVSTLSEAEVEVVGINGNDYTLNQVTANIFELDLNELESSRFFVDSKGLFQIAGNSAKAETDTSFVVTLEPVTSGNAPAINDLGIIANGGQLPFNLEIFCESTTTFDWATFKLEPSSYRTSPNFQFQEALSTANTSLVYRISPLGGLDDLGILAEVNSWSGIARIFKTDNFQMWLEDDQLNVEMTGLSTQVTVTPGFVVFAQVNATAGSLKIYINKKLVVKKDGNSGFAGFAGSLNSTLDISQTTGQISLKRLVFFDSSFEDGDILLQGEATSEVKDIFDDETLITSSQINDSVTHMHLPQVLIPGATKPTADAYIQAVKNITRTIQVSNLNNFAIGDAVYIVRFYADSPSIILDTTIVNIDAPNKLIRLNNIDGVRAQDSILKGAISTPGSASVRFNFFPIDSQEIRAIFPGSNELELGSATAFSLGRTFIYDVDYRDVAEINVTAIDLANKRITVSDLDGIEVNYIASQPSFETLISPANYFIGFQQDVDRVIVEAKYTNGVVLQNFNTFPVRVSPEIKIAL